MMPTRNPVRTRKRRDARTGWIPRGGLFLHLLFGALLAAGQNAGALRGKIIDRNTRKPLPAVEIRLAATDLKTRSRADGAYLLPGIPPGVYTLEAVLAGYTAEVRKNIVIRGGETAVLDLELEEWIPRIEEHVSVVGATLPPNRQAAGETARILGEEIRTMPGGVEDLSRALKTIPGISQISDVSNELMVRGGSPWENGFYIDNIPVPDINHFQNQGNSGGIIGILETDRIEDVGFYLGGFSPAYGDRMSSITEVRLKEGARDRIRGRVRLNTAGFGGGLESPLFDGRGSLSVSLRRSYHDIVAELIGYGVAPRFGDGLVKFAWDLGPRHRIRIVGLAGASRMAFGVDTAVREGFNNAIDYETAQSTAGIDWRALWKNGFSETSLSYSSFANDYALTDVTKESRYFVADTGRRTLTLRNINTWQVSPQNRIVFGLDLIGERERFNNYFAAHISRWDLPIPETAAAGDHAAAKAGAFVEYTASFAAPLTVSMGLRTDYYSFSGRASVSPRISAVLRLSSRWSLRAAAGRYSQSLPLYLSANLPDARRLRDPSARHLVLGLEYRIGDRTFLSIESYDKEYRSMPLTPQDPGVFVMDGAVNFGYYQTYDLLVDQGRANARGADFVFRTSGERFSGVFGLTLMKSRFQDLSGIWRNRNNDNRYILSLIGTFRPNGFWAFSLRGLAVGGAPYTPCDPERSQALRLWIIDPNRINAERYPAYAAVHFRIDRRWTFNRSSLLVYLSVMNVSNRKNILAYAWSVAENRAVPIYQSPILPEFGVEWSF